jgi:hypothetical protein
MTNRVIALAALSFATLSFGETAQGQTFVHPQGNFGNERCLVGDAAGLCPTGGTYGGAISIIHAMEMDLDLPTGSIVRVSDSFDQIWQALPGSQVLARARYAAHTLRLGFDDGNGYEDLIGNAASNTVYVGDPTEFWSTGTPHTYDFQQLTNTWVDITPSSAGALFAFVLRDRTPSPSVQWTSNNSGAGVGSAGYPNSGGDDHMVTFSVSPTHYFLAFEDLPYLLPSDLDFNDMVVEVMFVTAVPLPAALPLLLTGLLGFGGLGALRARRTQV